jgi:aminoglycoside phosphotransferase (APT) family kinase protein
VTSGGIDIDIDAQLVSTLVREQFPQWAGMPVVAVHPGGVDNRTFRLGDRLSVRLPSAQGYVEQVAKEHRWLPWLAPQLPLPIAQPVGLGRPSAGYPFPWSVYGWVEGDTMMAGRPADLTRLATDLADFLRALQRVDASDGPTPGTHCFLRGAHPEVYADGTEQALAALGDEVDQAGARHVWDAALAARVCGPPVWFHGDVAGGNLLLRDGRLSAVIDFGTCGVGDPACDTVFAWTELTGASRDAWMQRLDLDAGTWARGRGWALWKALITLNGQLTEAPSAGASTSRRVIDVVIADQRRRSG